MDNFIAVYLRLSQEDGGGGESNSISSQRQIIRHYIEKTADLAPLPVIEFVDDGYSGTSFNRPGIQKLLCAVRHGDCVIVKDFSRFGRCFVDAGRYIELIFPYAGVRFISVNDAYDSAAFNGAPPDIGIAARNLINALYSRDISQKTKSAKRAQSAQGKFIGAFAPYGYKKDGANKHSIVIDEPAAQVVRRVFYLACEGSSPLQIANTLNAEGVPTPSAYKAKNGSNLAVTGITPGLWSGGTVIGILRDERYTGTFVGGKYEADKPGTGRRKRVPEERRVRLPNAHPAIIPAELWAAATAKRGKQSGKHKPPATERFLYKKIRCGYCGHVMRHKMYGNRRYYFCETTKYTNEYGCTTQKYPEDAPANAAQEVLRLQTELFFEENALCRSIENADGYKTPFASPKKSLKDALRRKALPDGAANALIEAVLVFGRNRIEVKLSYGGGIDSRELCSCATSAGIVGPATWNRLYAVYKNIEDNVSPAPAPGLPAYPGYFLRVGSAGESVVTVQEALNQVAQGIPSVPKVTVDGNFGNETHNAVLAFQRYYGLTADGVVGSVTWNKLMEEAAAVGATPKPPVSGAPPFPGVLLRVGSVGENVRTLQEALNIAAPTIPGMPQVAADGIFGNQTLAAVLAYQRQAGLTADGIVGQTTWDSLMQTVLNIEAAPPATPPEIPEFPGFYIALGSVGNYVLLIQRYLNSIAAKYPSIPTVTPDSIFGPATRAAVIAFQRQFGLTADGIVGQQTWNKIMEVYYGL